jgi:hypothetical protein
MAKWQIGRRVASCCACETEFKDGDKLYSLLRVSDEGLERADLCLACHDEETLAGALFWWRTRHQVEEQRGLKLDLEALEALFLALDPEAATATETPAEEDGSSAEPAAGGAPESGGSPTSERLLELRYLLCLILLRKRRLKVTKVARKHNGVEGEFFLVKRPRRTEELVVQVFDFDADKIATLRDDLQRIFEGADPAELAGSTPVPLASATAEASEGARAPDGIEMPVEGAPDPD